MTPKFTTGNVGARPKVRGRKQGLGMPALFSAVVLQGRTCVSRLPDEHFDFDAMSC